MFDIHLIDEEFVGIRFPYDPDLVHKMRELDIRRWNPRKRRWEVHIAHLADLIRIFYLHPTDIDPKILALYRKNWIEIQIRLSVGNNYTRIAGRGLPVDAIDKACSFPVCGHRYHPNFIKGQWDGRRHLFNKRDFRVPTGFLGILKEILKKEKVPFRLIDKRKKTRATLSEFDHRIELRDYQEEAAKRALKKKRGVLEMATGSGKTVVAAVIISRLRRECLLFVHTRDLLYQTKEYLEKNLKTRVGIVGDGTVDIRPITVATIQTTARALGMTLPPEGDEPLSPGDATQLSESQEKQIVGKLETVPVVFFDECHHLPADTCYEVAMRMEKAEYRYGLSATPYRTDGHDPLMTAALGPKIYTAKASLLISKGYLVPPEIFVYVTPRPKNIPKKKDYHAVVERCITNCPERNEFIAGIAMELNERDLSTLILVSQIPHGKKLSELIPGSFFIQGRDKSETRRRAIRDLQKKKIMSLIATTLADEGLDIPNLNALILAGGGKSETRVFQRIGRALRPAPGKNRAIIVDFLDRVPYLQNHSMKRIEIYRTEPMFEIKTVGFNLNGKI